MPTSRAGSAAGRGGRCAVPGGTLIDVTDAVATGNVVPLPFDAAFARLLRARKTDFVVGDEVVQHGAAAVETTRVCPGWPTIPQTAGVIETFVVSAAGDVAPTSDNEPFVSAWVPIVTWMVREVHAALGDHGCELDGDGYLTASLTATADLEGTAHMDDDSFVPDQNVGAVAIMGQLAGPRVAIGSLSHAPLRPMTQLQYSDDVMARFEARAIDSAEASADQLVIFPQFGQLHAGPAASQVGHVGELRQLLVYRAGLLVGMPRLGEPAA